MVRSGLDRLCSEKADLIRGRRIGLLCHHASFTRELVFAADAITAAGGQVVRLFGPEHGPWGTAQDMIGVDGGRDPWTDLPLVSLYGHDESSLRPDPAAFEGLDVLVADLQDVGARYYTYAATIAMTVEVAQEVGLEVIVCDRPNPIDGVSISGNDIHPELHSFVGAYSVPVRHGLSLGELVQAYTGGKATVVPLEGWSRNMWFDETGLPWIPPSPNMPTLTTAAIYPGLCLIEGTNVSEGRGTTTPFELVGAPWVDPFRFARELTARDLPGLAFRPHVFQPMFQKHAGDICGGVQILVTDRRAQDPLLLGLTLLQVLRLGWPDDFRWRTETYEFVDDRLAIDLLLGAPGIREALEAGERPRAIMASFAADEQRFAEERKQWLLS